ncbi:Low-density lipoprotein receptor-related protein 8, partial [Fragariocoptes setiger]
FGKNHHKHFWLNNNNSDSNNNAVHETARNLSTMTPSDVKTKHHQGYSQPVAAGTKTTHHMYATQSGMRRFGQVATVAPIFSTNDVTTLFRNNHRTTQISHANETSKSRLSALQTQAPKITFYTNQLAIIEPSIVSTNLLQQSNSVVQLGAQCRRSQDCASISGAHCDADTFQCTCMPYHVRYNASACLPATLLGYACKIDAQCTKKVPNSLCIAGACECLPNHVQHRKDKCLPPTSISEYCLNDIQCRLNDKYAFCKWVIPTIYGKCSCPAAHLVLDTRCAPLLGDQCDSDADCAAANPNAYCQRPSRRSSRSQFMRPWCACLAGFEQRQAQDKNITICEPIGSITITTTSATTTLTPTTTTTATTTTTTTTRAPITEATTTERTKTTERPVITTTTMATTMETNLAGTDSVQSMNDRNRYELVTNSHGSATTTVPDDTLVSAEHVTQASIPKSNSNNYPAKDYQPKLHQQQTISSSSSSTTTTTTITSDVNINNNNSFRPTTRAPMTSLNDSLAITTSLFEYDSPRMASLGKTCRTSRDCQIRDPYTHCVGGVCECQRPTSQCSAQQTGCHSDTFQCRNGQCISWYFVCDKFKNCADGSDEECARGRCPRHAYQCNDGTCISRAKVCNGQRDCPDSSDESQCSSHAPCDPKAFRCNNGQCLPQFSFCNAIEDCADGSDEDERICELNRTGSPVVVNLSATSRESKFHQSAISSSPNISSLLNEPHLRARYLKSPDSNDICPAFAFKCSNNKCRSTAIL